MAKSKKTNSKKKTTTKKSTTKKNSTKKVVEEVKEENKKVKAKKAKEIAPKKVEKEVKEKNSLWVKFRIFCHGVVAETKKIHWPNKVQVFKYSVATIAFVVFLALFFYLIDVIFAAVQALFK